MPEDLVMALLDPESQDFVDRLRPVLETRDRRRLMEYVQRRLTPGQLLEALDSDDRDTVNVALVCFAGIGTMEHAAAVAKHLRSWDPMTVKLAEHALWSIWFRAGDERANSDLRCIVGMIDEGRLDKAIAALDQLATRCPGFAEVLNQRAIAAFLLGDYQSATEDCRRTLRLNPYHFGAMAGLANCLAMAGDLDAALQVYRQVRELYPSLEGLIESIRHVRRCVAESRKTDIFPSA
jgi:tetratricopeptide (TPR) repeat protein